MLEIGQLVDGKYKILNKIGQGGMSVVYLAMNEKANKQWAIKEVRKDGKQDFDVVKQGLVAEIDMLKRLNHPNLPSIIDIIDGDGTFLIVMDYIEGIPLDKKLKESGPQDQNSVIEWSKQLCDVLGYLHSRRPPIIYRDMKPANVMLKPDGSVTLIDFGTAREFKDTSVADTTCLGTRGYAAPEQFGGLGQTDARTDIYCLGATMYHLITGHNPSEYPYEMYPIRQWNPLLSSGLEEIILKCTQQNPAARYQSCAELMYALEHYQELDIENKKVQNFKWKIFLSSVIIAAVMGAGAVTFSLLESHETAETYESYVINAKNQATAGEAFDSFSKAIALSPDNKEAYNKMLDYVMDDTIFSEDESKYVTELTSNLDEFRKKAPEDYADFCYDLGINYYFCYDSQNEMEGPKKSARWFEEALGVDGFSKNDQNKYTRAKIMHTMAVNSSGEKWGRLDNQGNVDPETSYESYWNDIETLTSMDLADTENVTVALLINQNFANAILSNANEFAKVKGLDKETVKAKLEDMKAKLSIENLSRYPTYYAETHDGKIREVNADIDKAMDAVEQAFNTKRQPAEEVEQ